MKNSSLILKEICVYAAMMAVLYLFYRSLWVLILLPVCVIFYRRISRKEIKKKNIMILEMQFKDLLDSMAAALRAGYSIENSLIECIKEMNVMYGEDSLISAELRIMINQIRLGINAEEVFKEMAQRSGAENIEIFASVFSIAKRTGGDMVEIIKKTATDIGAKIDTRNEIAVLVSAKRLEQKIMTLIPVGIIIYIDLTSDGLLDPLYGNAAGILIMSACLAIYIASILLGKKIMDIEV